MKTSFTAAPGAASLAVYGVFNFQSNSGVVYHAASHLDL
jgi:hypothetical protein